MEDEKNEGKIIILSFRQGVNQKTKEFQWQCYKIDGLTKILYVPDSKSQKPKSPKEEWRCEVRKTIARSGNGSFAIVTVRLMSVVSALSRKKSQHFKQSALV